MFFSGLSALDAILFDGNGVPPGSLIELHGTEDSGKTALALWFCRVFQESTGEPITWISTETAIKKRNLIWAGVDPNNSIIVTQSPNMPGLIAAQHCLSEGARLVVIDSIAALIDETMEKPLNQVLSADLFKIKCQAIEAKAVVILTNQERHRLPGRGLTRTGACPALTRLTDCQIRLQSGQGLYRGGIQEGIRVYFKVTKNGMDFANWDKVGRFNLWYSKGLKDIRGREQADGASREAA